MNDPDPVVVIGTTDDDSIIALRQWAGFVDVPEGCATFMAGS